MDGNDNVKEYCQPLESVRTLYFDRFTTTDEAKCNEEKRKALVSMYTGFELIFCSC